uniref:Uncharacterized protein n=1 Tax=Lepeophtheirus salmonis TaxID=72036 RepID=A0A0K2VK72_LEPSM
MIKFHIVDLFYISIISFKYPIFIFKGRTSKLPKDSQVVVLILKMCTESKGRNIFCSDNKKGLRIYEGAVPFTI